MTHRNVRFSDKPQQRLIAANRAPPLPYPEPPRVINPRPFVPDLSIVADRQPPPATSSRTPLYPSHYPSALANTRLNSQQPPQPTPAFQRQPMVYNHQPFIQYGQQQYHPPAAGVVNCYQPAANGFNPHTQQLAVRETGTDVLSPIAHQANQELYQMVKQQDEQLQIIADTVQELLRITKATHQQQQHQPLPSPRSTPKARRPQMLCAGTMTSIAWTTPPMAQRSSACILTPSPEKARAEDKDDSEIFEDMLTNIEDILNSSKENSGPGAETIYINRLATKYLGRPFRKL